jgi:hypothetical protein
LAEPSYKDSVLCISEHGFLQLYQSVRRPAASWLSQIGTRKMCRLIYCRSTQCAITDRIKSLPEIVFLQVKPHDVRTVFEAQRTGSEA